MGKFKDAKRYLLVAAVKFVKCHRAMKFLHMIPYSISFKSCLNYFSVKCNWTI